jgi:hypothetical protein
MRLQPLDKLRLDAGPVEAAGFEGLALTVHLHPLDLRGCGCAYHLPPCPRMLAARWRARSVGWAESDSYFRAPRSRSRAQNSIALMLW